MPAWRPSKRLKIVALVAAAALAVSGATLAVAAGLLPHPVAIPAESTSQSTAPKSGPDYTPPAVDESALPIETVIPSEAPENTASPPAEESAAPPPAAAVSAPKTAPILCPTGGIVLNLVSAKSTANTNEALIGSYFAAINIHLSWSVTNQSASTISLISPEVMAVTGSSALGVSTPGANVPGTLVPNQTASVFSSGLATTSEWNRMTGWAFKSIGSYAAYVGANQACAKPPISVATGSIDKGGLVIP